MKRSTDKKFEKLATQLTNNYNKEQIPREIRNRDEVAKVFPVIFIILLAISSFS